MFGRISAVCLCLTMLGVLSAATADTVELHDGRQIQGRVTSPEGSPVVEIETSMGKMRYRSTMVRKITLGGEGAEPAAGDRAEAEAEKIDPKTRHDYAEAGRAAAKATTGADGLAIWEAFLREHPEGTLSDMARAQRKEWQAKADANLVKFGPQWLPKDQVADRMEKADSLASQAESAGNLDKAVALLNEAAKQHPYRADIPFRKAKLYQDANRLREYGIALGEVVAIEDDHVAARNNLGVLAAQQEAWGVAIRNLAIAAAAQRSDQLLDNMDQAIHMAEVAGYSQSQITAADSQMRRIVEEMHKDGEKLGQTRWGNSWVSQATHDRYIAENKALDRQIDSNNTRLKSFEGVYRNNQRIIRDYERLIKGNKGGVAEGANTRYDQKDAQRLIEVKQKHQGAVNENKKIETEAKKVQADIKKLESQKNVQPHAGKLVVLELDGRSSAGEVEAGGPSADKPKAGDALFD